MLSKTTTNYARKRGLDVTNHVSNEGDSILSTEKVYNTIWVWELDNENEPLFVYRANDDGSFTWDGNVYLPTSIKEELPAHLKDETALRSMLNYVALEMANLS